MAAALALVTACASHAGAQAAAEPHLVVAGGHQLSESFRARSLREWFVTVAGPLNDRMAVVGEVAGVSVRQAGSGHAVLVGLRHAWPGPRWTGKSGH